jgi:hypothetical protein
MYPFLNNRPVEMNVLGLPVERRVNIKVELTANQLDYTIEENSPLERHFPVGLWVTLPGQKVNQVKTQAAGNIFNSAYLVLRHQEANIMVKVPFEQIRLANANGRPFYMNMPGPVNLSESTLVVPDNAGIAANTVLEFQVEYVKTAQAA